MKKKDKFTTEIVLETRVKIKPKKQANKNKEPGKPTYPVKLRVYINEKYNYYSTKHYLTKDEFKAVFDNKNRGKYKELYHYYTSFQNKAIDILNKMEDPNLTDFSRLFINKGAGTTVLSYYEKRIKELEKQNQYNTAETYKNTKKSMEKYKSLNISFKQITAQWLKDYQKKMYADGKSRNTLSIYIRTLRYLYNKAIKDGTAKQNSYPFGKGKYDTPSSVNNKRPLQMSEIVSLRKYKGELIREKYRDFFLLSYYLSGQNYADILTMKPKQIDTFYNTVTFYRKKTDTKIEVDITPSVWEIINKYGNMNNYYIFDVIKPTDTAKETNSKINTFVRNSNQTLKRIAKEIGITPKISTMFARHSAASHSLAMGANIAEIGQLMGHKNIKTTSSYISSLQGNRKKTAEQLEKIASGEYQPEYDVNEN